MSRRRARDPEAVARARARPQDDMRQLLARAARRPRARDPASSRINTAFVQERGLVGGPERVPVPRSSTSRHRAITERWSAIRATSTSCAASFTPAICRSMSSTATPRSSMFIELEDEGADLVGAAATRSSRNQVVSSFAGEFDHKSTFEVLTTPELAIALHDRPAADLPPPRAVDPDRARHQDDRPRRRADRSGAVAAPQQGPPRAQAEPLVRRLRHRHRSARRISPSGTTRSPPRCRRTPRETGGVVAQRYVDVRVKDFPILGRGRRTSRSRSSTSCAAFSRRRRRRHPRPRVEEARRQRRSEGRADRDARRWSDGARDAKRRRHALLFSARDPCRGGLAGPVAHRGRDLVEGRVRFLRLQRWRASPGSRCLRHARASAASAATCRRVLRPARR